MEEDDDLVLLAEREIKGFTWSGIKYVDLAFKTNQYDACYYDIELKEDIWSEEDSYIMLKVTEAIGVEIYIYPNGGDLV